MAKPDIFITGMRHSGTTWCASLFESAGFDIGEGELHGISPRQGREWRPGFGMLGDLNRRMGGEDEPTRRDWWRPDPALVERVRAECGPGLAELDWPEVVKVPGLAPSQFWDYINPLHIIVMRRDPTQWARSMQSNRYAKKHLSIESRTVEYVEAIGLIVEAAAGRPHTVIDFEDSVKDAGYAFKKLGGLLGMDLDDFEILHGRVARPDWVGVNARNGGI